MPSYNPNDLDNGWYGTLTNATESGVRKLLTDLFLPGLTAPAVISFYAHILSHVPTDLPVAPTTVVIEVPTSGVKYEADAARLYNHPSADYFMFCLANGIPMDHKVLNRLRFWTAGDESLPPPTPPPPSSPIGIPAPHLDNPINGNKSYAALLTTTPYPEGGSYMDATGTYVLRRRMFNVWWEKVS